MSSPKYSPARYREWYRQSVENPAKFWSRMARRELDWFKPFQTSLSGNVPDYAWFDGGQINISYNCLDRHVLNGRGDRVAYSYTNELNEHRQISYADLLTQVNQAANLLLSLGIIAGDRVVIYMPLTIEQIVLMLACARIGAIHSVVYAGFSAEALAFRIQDCQAKLVCTATWTQKQGKRHDLLSVVREAVRQSPTVQHTLVLQRSGTPVKLQSRELDFQREVAAQSSVREAAPVPSSAPLFILYTSGTTGTPKGVVHSHAGYNLYSHLTFKLHFDIQPAHIHWSAADTGWITGHSYIVYGPLSNGVTSILYEGSAMFPDPAAYWRLIEQFRVRSFYTAPTVLRLLMREGDEYPQKYDLSSLRVIGSVGEPINPVVWHWYARVIGRNKAKVIDTWWQTETGGHVLVTPPSMKQKPGSAGLPFLGIQPAIVDDDGNRITQANHVGNLVILQPWPGALTTCWNNPDRFKQYWNEYPDKNFFYTGDVAFCDEEGYFTVLGRADDVINVAGIRVSSAEVEHVLMEHDAVSEAAVIGSSDEIKGEVVKAFVVLQPNVEWSDDLGKELQAWVRKKIGHHAQPATVTGVSKLPKTRSGKIMRRILKAREMGLAVGDTSTLED